MNSILYIVVNYGIQVLNIVINLLFMYQLPVRALGDIAIAKIWLQILDYNHLGTRFAIDRYLPVTNSSKLRGNYLFLSIVLMAVTSFITLSLAIYMNDSNYIVYSFLLVGVVLSYINLIKAYYRAVGEIRVVNLLIFKCYFFPLLLSLLALLYSFALFLLLYPFLFICTFVYFAYPKIKKSVVRFENKAHCLAVCRKVFHTAKWLFLFSILMYLFLVVDRIFVEMRFDREVLGEYSVVMFVFSSLFTMPSIITELVFRKVVIQVVDDGRVFFPREILIVLSATVLAIVVANFLMRVVLPYTDYFELYEFMVFASIGVIPYAIVAVVYHVINALDLRKELICAVFSSLILYITMLFNFGSSVQEVIYLKVASGYVLLFTYLLVVAYSKLVRLC